MLRVVGTPRACISTQNGDFVLFCYSLLGLSRLLVFAISGLLLLLGQLLLLDLEVVNDLLHLL